MHIQNIATALMLGCGICAAADSLPLQLFRTLSQETEGNFAYSPAGVENVLNTLRQYSAGQTLAELNTLPINRQKTRYNINVTQADALFVADQLPLLPNVKNAVRIDFGKSQDAAQTINNWCTEHTHGLIKKLVQASDFSDLTAFVATNAIYLKENWRTPFDPSESFTGEFTTADGKTVPAHMMSRTAKFPAAKGEDWVAIALPYAASAAHGKDCYFIAISPTKDVKRFAAGLTEQKYRAILNRIDYARGQTRVVMPSFTIDADALNMNSALKAAGLKTIFTKADFSRLTPTKKEIYLSKVLQKCYVKVDEQGTEAAAATTAIANFRALPRSVVLDRPFIWIIGSLSATDTPLFMGIMETP